MERCGICADVKDRDKVAVAQPGQDSGFALLPVGLVVSYYAGTEKLDRHLSAEHLVARLIHRCHPALTDGRAKLVPPAKDHKGCHIAGHPFRFSSTSRHKSRIDIPAVHFPSLRSKRRIRWKTGAGTGAGRENERRGNRAGQPNAAAPPVPLR